MHDYNYDDADADAKRIAESIGGPDAFTKSVRRAFRDSYERAFYAGYFRRDNDQRARHRDGELAYD